MSETAAKTESAKGPEAGGDAPPAIHVADLRLRAGDRTLLENASATVERGELVLLVGASGTGKSLTLALLSGLLRRGGAVAADGTVIVLGEDVLARPDGAGVPGAGIVFQDFALLDDVDARGNVLFGLDHGAPFAPSADHPAAEARLRAADDLLAEFGLPPDMYPAQMSGGMKQRLALARAMAFGPRLLFYDEPTSGLDPAMSLEVAQRIRAAHDRHDMTSVVVTHDLVSLKDIADRVILLDPRERRLREVAPADVDAALADLRSFRANDPERTATGRNPLKAITGFFEAAGNFVVGAANTLVHLVPRYPSAPWGWRFLWHYMRLCAVGTALPFLALAGLIAGFITTFFMFSLLPMQGFTEPVLAEEFIGSLGYVLYRVIVPGLTTLLFASRAGAAIAADVGNRVLTRQADAFRSHGVPPDRYLLTGLGLSSLIGIPVLYVASYVCARMAAVAVFLATHSGHGSYSFNQEFDRLIEPGDVWFVLGKLLICALGTAAIAYHVGMREKPSGASVAAGVTSTIIRATVFVLAVHLVFAFFEF